MREVLRREVAEPLGGDGLTFGAALDRRDHIARPHPLPPAIGDGLLDRVGGRASTLRRTRGFGEVSFAPGPGNLVLTDGLHDI